MWPVFLKALQERENTVLDICNSNSDTAVFEDSGENKEKNVFKNGGREKDTQRLSPIHSWAQEENVQRIMTMTGRIAFPHLCLLLAASPALSNGQ